MLKLRNLDPDSQDVPLPNACSANSCFQERRRVLAGKNKETEILYETSSHTEKNLEQHIQYVIDNADWIAKRFEYNENTKNTMIKDMKDNLKKVRELKEKAESGQELSEKEKEQMNKIVNEVNGITISNVAKSPGKYTYHKVGVVGVLGNGEDRITYTIETFAAEAKQYVVSPFTNNVAIGRYRGGD